MQTLHVHAERGLRPAAVSGGPDVSAPSCSSSGAWPYRILWQEHSGGLLDSLRLHWLS